MVNPRNKKGKMIRMKNIQTEDQTNNKTIRKNFRKREKRIEEST
jgi:hypothetical protein